MDRNEYLMRAHEFAPRGNRLPQAQLTPDAVKAIRANVYGKTMAEQAVEFGVSKRCIERVRAYETWRHV